MSNGNGTINYLNAAQDAAQQAVADLQLFEANNNEALRSMAIGADFASAIGSIAGAAAGWATAGVGLAGLLTGGGKGDSLEIEVSNFSSQPLVLYNYNPARGNVSKIVQPLSTGESDTFILDYPDDTFDTSTQIELDFLIGTIQASVTYKYTDSGDPGRWQVVASIDGDGGYKFDTKLQLFGATFRANSSSNPSFSWYTSPIESSSGQMSLAFYDLAAA
ncbi:hypothetical protein NGR_b22450 (plasmid) [Sinorhizobium fredii NGR234]|uniref:Uncharacterized protein n=1 Tax=Sinorhizobium fredii (strain NBRC 101917 / NGR234) TaxID=394 RepID=C3KN60_SINFN|nr:hypothetical protein [Sinorhizobium fredii]ACP23690.1 hypothetical protein NGR_b22450 [Sinorhizobium fredii NGR234]